MPAADRRRLSQVLTNLTLTPALLLAFPRFFSSAAVQTAANISALPSSSLPAPTADDAEVAAATQISTTVVVPADDSAPAAAGEHYPSPPRALVSSCAKCAAGRRPNFWARLAFVTRVYKYSIAVAVVALLVAPFAYRLPGFRSGLSQSLRNIAPRGTPSVDALYELQASSPRKCTPRTAAFRSSSDFRP